MIKKYLLLLCVLAVQIGCLASCGEAVGGSSVSAVGTVSEQPSVSVAVSGAHLEDRAEEYLSTEGDGEILCLYADGTFVTYTVTDLTAEGDNGSVPFSMTERVNGVYTCQEDEIHLSIREIVFSVTGLEEFPELVQQQADAMAGDDSALRSMYLKLFGGSEVSGRELLGEEKLSKLLSSVIPVKTDQETSTFSYQRRETDS